MQRNKNACVCVCVCLFLFDCVFVCEGAGFLASWTGGRRISIQSTFARCRCESTARRSVEEVWGGRRREEEREDLWCAVPCCAAILPLLSQDSRASLLVCPLASCFLWLSSTSSSCCPAVPRGAGGYASFLRDEARRKREEGGKWNGSRLSWPDLSGLYRLPRSIALEEGARAVELIPWDRSTAYMVGKTVYPAERRRNGSEFMTGLCPWPLAEQVPCLCLCLCQEQSGPQRGFCGLLLSAAFYELTDECLHFDRRRTLTLIGRGSEGFSASRQAIQAQSHFWEPQQGKVDVSLQAFYLDSLVKDHWPGWKSSPFHESDWSWHREWLLRFREGAW